VVVHRTDVVVVLGVNANETVHSNARNNHEGRDQKRMICVVSNEYIHNIHVNVKGYKFKKRYSGEDGIHVEDDSGTFLSCVEPNSNP
jgi:hypothetical protein